MFKMDGEIGEIMKGGLSIENTSIDKSGISF